MGRKLWVCLLVSMALAAVPYIPLLRAGFVWDDRVMEELQLPHFGSILDVFRPPEGIPQWNQGTYYRPVVMLSHLADMSLNNALLGKQVVTAGMGGSERAHIPHAMTLLFHLLVTGAVVLLADQCMPGEGELRNAGIWTAGIVFALHPIHSESVSLVAGRSDILAALFVVLSILCILRDSRRSLWLPACAGVLFLAALLSKEVAVAAFLFAPLCLWLRNEGGEPHQPRLHRRWLIPYALAFLIYIGLRAGAGGVRLPEPLAGGIPVLQRFFEAAAYYAGKIVFPWPLTPLVPDLPGRVETSFGLLILLATGIGAFIALRRGRRFYAFCWLWFVLFLAPSLVVSIRHYATTPVAERYLYLPSMGFAFALGGIVTGWSRTWAKRLLAVPGLILASFCAVTSWNASIAWGDEISLFSLVTSQEVAKDHPVSWVCLGNAYLRKGREAEAEETFRRAVEVGTEPNDFYRGLAYMRLGDISLRRFEGAFQNNAFPEALSRLIEAEADYSRATAITSERAEYWRQLSLVQIQRVIVEREMKGVESPGLIERAGFALKKAESIDPEDPETLCLVGILQDLVSLGKSGRTR